MISSIHEKFPNTKESVLKVLLRILQRADRGCVQPAERLTWSHSTDFSRFGVAPGQQGAHTPLDQARATGGGMLAARGANRLSAWTEVAMRMGWTPLATAQMQVRGTHVAAEGVEEVRLLHADRRGLHEARFQQLRRPQVQLLSGT